MVDMALHNGYGKLDLDLGNKGLFLALSLIYLDKSLDLLPPFPLPNCLKYLDCKVFRAACMLFQEVEKGGPSSLLLCPVCIVVLINRDKVSRERINTR